MSNIAIGQWVDCSFTAKVQRVGEYTATLSLTAKNGLETLFIVPIESLTLAWDRDAAEDKRAKAGK